MMNEGNFEMTPIPTLHTVKSGDILPSHLHTLAGRSWFYLSEVLSVEPIGLRMGTPDRLMIVLIRTNEGTDFGKKRIWFSQSNQGLV